MAAVVHRTATEKADRILYVTDAGQAQHFAMVFDAARAYNLVPAAAQLHHVPFGLVLVCIRKCMYLHMYLYICIMIEFE